jgi:DNA-binding NtrC family response regulator/tetratricopeptide (TPR) repeat protein
MNVLADRSGHQAVAPLLAQVRQNVIRLGDSATTAALHISVGELEAKRGLVSLAVRHTTLGQALLQKDGNVYLEGVSENTLMAVALIRCDPFDGIEHGNRAVRLAEESGSSSLRRAALGNLGNLYLLTGQFDLAKQYLDLAKSVPPFSGSLSNGTLESLAALALVEGRLKDAASLLDQMKASIRTHSDWMIYANRHARLTLVEMMARDGKVHEALKEIEQVVELGDLSGDRRLHLNALLTKADLLVTLGRSNELAPIIRRAVDELPEHPPDTYARYQRSIAMAFLGLGYTESAQRSFKRSKRTYDGLQNVSGRFELMRVWENAGGKIETDISSRTGNIEDVLQNTAALMLHAGRPELVGTGVVAILEDLGGIVSAMAVSKGADGSSETLAEFGNLDQASGNYFEHNFDLGTARGRSVEVRIRLCNDIQAVATLNAITILLCAIRRLERATVEREERLTLWPIDEIPPGDEQAVMLGKLSKLMAEARRVACTNVNILITGESGTGKEVLARAIHRYSSRTNKPFVPFNCSAIPREMLESQLFGHRRGAFTGADRDNVGVIRAAKDGTLLLDEVGELSPELQPKLLRFLESGEISPLGDPNPLTVDVRIIAATNANLDQLVQEGRFRDDLFYRLNVIRLIVPPLRERRDEIPALAHHFVARAAKEFGKSRVRLAEETVEHLTLYSWPGNVRQLNNELRRVVALADSDSTITPSALSKEILRSTPRVSRGNLDSELAVPLTDKLLPTLSRVECEMIKAALKTSGGKVDAAARALGISRKGLYLKRQRLGL